MDLRKVKLLIIDDHQLFIDGLSLALRFEISSIEIVTETDPEKALELLLEEPFSLVLMDFNMPKMHGIDLLMLFVERGVSVPSVVISGEFDPRMVYQAIELGASGFIPKAFSTEQLVHAICLVLQGKSYMPKDYERCIKQIKRMDAQNDSKNNKLTEIITERQLEVLRLMKKGYTNKRISSILNLSPDTVKDHIRAVFISLGVNNRVACILRAQELGLE